MDSKRFATFLLAAWLPLAAQAAEPAADPALEQRLHQELQDVLLRLAGTGALDGEAADGLAVQAPASRRAEFGAIIAGDGGAGASVLAVTPGGTAAALGLRAGDRILAVDGEALGATSSASVEALRQRLAGASGTLVLAVERDGRQMELSGPVRSFALPAYRLELGGGLAGTALAADAGDAGSSCGRISVFDSAPRGDQVYPAVLIAIDGRAPGPTSGPSYRVRPGVHELTVAEKIDPEQFSSLQRFQRDRRADGGYKTLTLDVRPGITYRLGAHFDLERRNFIRDNSYWEPVVWGEVAEACN